jgi:hypothetical protein
MSGHLKIQNGMVFLNEHTRKYFNALRDAPVVAALVRRFDEYRGQVVSQYGDIESLVDVIIIRYKRSEFGSDLSEYSELLEKSIKIPGTSSLFESKIRTLGSILAKFRPTTYDAKKIVEDLETVHFARTCVAHEFIVFMIDENDTGSLSPYLIDGDGQQKKRLSEYEPLWNAAFLSSRLALDWVNRTILTEDYINKRR